MNENQRKRHNRVSELRMKKGVKRKAKQKVVRLETEKAAIRLRKQLRRLRRAL